MKQKSGSQETPGSLYTCVSRQNVEHDCKNNDTSTFHLQVGDDSLARYTLRQQKSSSQMEDIYCLLRKNK